MNDAMTEAEVKRIDVFFYGLFMDEALLRVKGLNPKNRRIAFVDNVSLVIGARASLIARAGKRVHGVLFSLTHGEVDQLYSETTVRDYRPEAVAAQPVDGTAIPALCFNLPIAPSGNEQDKEYVAKLKELATRIGLPPNYVSSIEQVT
jgi:hypothetical protein